MRIDDPAALVQEHLDSARAYVEGPSREEIGSLFRWLGNVPGEVGLGGYGDRSWLVMGEFPTNEAELEWLVEAIGAWLAANDTVEVVSLTADGETMEIRRVTTESEGAS